jgi:hypothetical protein
VNRGAGARGSPASTCGSEGASFCVSSAGATPSLIPGAAPSPLPVTFTNPTARALAVSSLTVTFANAFPAGCDPRAFQVDGVAASGAEPSVTISFPRAVQIPGAGGSAPGTRTVPATLAMADDGRNQDACRGLRLDLRYSAQTSS